MIEGLILLAVLACVIYVVCKLAAFPTKVVWAIWIVFLLFVLLACLHWTGFIFPYNDSVDFHHRIWW